MIKSPRKPSLRESIKALDFCDILGKKQTILAGNRIVFLDADYDEDTESPNDHGCGEIRSFNNRHMSFITPEELYEILEETPKRVLPLDYYEHSACRWSLAGEGYQCQWDTSNHAGVYIAPEGEEADEAQARSYCEEYSNWCNGYIYWFGLRGYPVLKDTRGNVITDPAHYQKFGTPDFEDSCGGFDDLEYMQTEVLNFLPKEKAR